MLTNSFIHEWMILGSPGGNDVVTFVARYLLETDSIVGILSTARLVNTMSARRVE